MKTTLSDVCRIYPVKLNSYCKTLTEHSPAAAKMYLPDPRELNSAGLTDDGLGEIAQMPVPKFIRRYTDRAVLLCTDKCFVHCRFCFRKRQWKTGAEPMVLTEQELSEVCRWLDRNPEVTDILLSGGDIMTLPDDKVIEIASRIRSAGNVSSVRICSRAPAVEPERITDSIAGRLAEIEGLWFVTHFNHPDELTDAAHEACRKLIRNGIPVLDQTVLLSGINDDAETLKKLFKTLVSWRVKPHYLFHVDPIEGVAHFATGVQKGIDILKDFQLSLSSLATPAFAIDLPCGGGKLILSAAKKNEKGEWLSPVLKQYIRHPLTEIGGESGKEQE